MYLAIEYCSRAISENKASLNPLKYFIVIPALIGNGESISPSNSPQISTKFPAVTFADNVRAQYRLVTEELGIAHVRLVVGFSMGGAQAYQWAVQYPDFMDGIVPICASAKNSVHNSVFLEGVKSALIAARGGMSAGIGKGQIYPSSASCTPHQKEASLKAFARVYAGWGFSQAFYREKLFDRHYSCQDIDQFLVNFWEKWALPLDPDNLLVMLQTWQLGDISALPQFAGDFRAALQSIKARVLVCPSKTDLYFPPEDSEFEVENIPEGRGRLEVIPSIWGHWAGAPGDSKKDEQFLDETIAKFLLEI